MIVVNLYGGPGSGKSTTAAGIFSELKMLGLNVELVTEYAKDKVWEKHEAILDNQIYVFAKQYHRLFRLTNQVEVVVTDAPILLSTIYNKDRTLLGTSLDTLVVEAYNTFNNVNYFLKRTKKYNPKGRLQTEDEAKELDIQINNMLDRLSIPYDIHEGANEGKHDIVDDIMRRLA